MAISMTQEKKKQKYSLIILGLALVLIFFVVWWGFLREVAVPMEPLPVIEFEKVEVDWQLLKDPELERLKIFKEIPLYEEEIGRENPFLPY